MTGLGARMDETGSMIDLLREQCGMYRRLRLLADRQRGLVYQEDARPLLELLGERQKLVDGLIGLSARLSDYRGRWAEIYGKLDPVTRREVAGLLEESNSALGSILQGDGRDSQILAARRADLSEQLATTSAHGRAGAAYRAASFRGSASFTNTEA